MFKPLVGISNIKANCFGRLGCRSGESQLSPSGIHPPTDRAEALSYSLFWLSTKIGLPAPDTASLLKFSTVKVTLINFPVVVLSSARTVYLLSDADRSLYYRLVRTLLRFLASIDYIDPSRLKLRDIVIN